MAGEYDKVLRFKATSNATYTMGAYGNTSSTGIRSNNGTGTNETWYVKSTGETASLPTSFALNNQSSAEDVMYLANQGKNFTYPVTNFGTLVVPFDATISGGITAYDLTSATSDKVFGIEVAELTANKPVLLKGTGTLTLAKKAEGTAEVGVDLTNGLLTGVYSSTEAPVCSYVLQKLAGDSEVCFHQVAVGSQPTVKPFRAYLTNGGAGVKLSLDLDGLTDAIEQVNDEGVVTISEVYGLSGVRQSGLQRGINLVRTADGRVQKVMIK
ncbi:MAG: hypothetical protein IJ739_03230 [Bacteroidaceae bacterium]|nr:hypothetical protein [Bacteroidaceae bacterium]